MGTHHIGVAGCVNEELFINLKDEDMRILCCQPVSTSPTWPKDHFWLVQIHETYSKSLSTILFFLVIFHSFAEVFLW